MVTLITDGVIPNTDYKKYIIDTVSELSQLETTFGNEAYCIGNATTYICDGSGDYVRKKVAGEDALPGVTSDDDGKVLRVDEGHWSVDDLDDTYARIDGYYEGMSVGNADQLLSTVGIVDTTPYIFRATGGSADVVNRENIHELIGGTVAWNQLIQNGNFASASNWLRNRCDLTVSNNVGHFVCNSADYSSWGFYQSPHGIVGHKYMGIGSFRCNTTNAARSLTFQSSGVRMTNVVGRTRQNYPENDVWYDLSFIGIFNEISATASCNLGFSSLSDITVGTDYIEAKNVMLIDLTQMFGPNIADYIYSLESESTGSGIAYFRRLFPGAYYAYNAGEFISIKPSAHKTIGFNAWDEEWELGAMNDFTGANSVSSSNIRSKNYIRVVPNTTYSIECASGHRYYLFYYDADKNYLGRNDANNKGTFLSDGRTYYRTMTSNCHYVRFFYDATSYGDDFCMHLKLSGYRDGEYRAYSEHNYPLANTELKGLFKINNNELYTDGDIYVPDGTVTRRFYVASSADCTVGTYDANTYRWTLTLPSAAPDQVSSESDGLAGNFMASKYFVTIPKNRTTGSSFSISRRDASSSVVARGFIFTLDSSSITSVSDARDWVTNNPFSIIYECVESTEQVSSYASTMIVDDFGTEEFVDERAVQIPVGHETLYQANLRDKLQHLPSLPDPLQNGDYIISVSGQQMSLVPDSGGVMNVNLTYDSENDCYHADRTVAAIVELIKGGNSVQVSFEIPQYYPGYEYVATVSLAVNTNASFDSERTFYELVAQVVDSNSRCIALLDTMGVTADSTTWYMRFYPIGCMDVVFDGTYNSGTGDFSWDCDTENDAIIARLDMRGNVRAKVWFDTMTDSDVYLTQMVNDDGLVAFYGDVNLTIGGNTNLYHCELHQTTEDNWESVLTPADAGGSGTLYTHYITLYKGNYRIHTVITNASSTAFTSASLSDYLEDNGINNDHAVLPATGMISSSGTMKAITGIYYSTAGSLMYASTLDLSSGREGGYAFPYDNFSIEDVVVEI